MGALRKGLFVIWSLIYLIIPITEFGKGVTYSKDGAKCSNVNVIYFCLIGAGVVEGILLFAIIVVVYFCCANTSHIVHITTKVATFAMDRP